MRRGGNDSAERIDLVWFSEIQWDFLSTRKQRLLARFPEAWRILFIEPFAVGRRSHWLPVKRGRVTVVTVPVAVLVLALQRRIISGLTAGAIKG